MFLVRIFTADFYMNPPLAGLDIVYSEFRAAAVQNVPVIRIFGSTEQGQKTCLHIHGAFPYLYIPYEGSGNVETLMHQIAAKLDQAINTSFGQAASTAKHIYKICLVSGIPFYGYHTREHQFLKIYFYNPLVMKKGSALLQNGSILGKVYQLHEAHIPFVLQFMIDYNLHGMNYISLSQVQYRVYPDDTCPDISNELKLPSHIPKISICQLEVDGLVEHIVNRFELIMGGVAKNPGIAALWEDEKQRRRNKNQDSQISPCLSQTRTNIPPTESHVLFQKALHAKLILSEDKKEHKIEEQHSIVYPAEAPRSKKIMSASFVETHHSSLSSYPSSSLDDSEISNLSMDMLDDTLNASLDDTVTANLLEVLNDLGNNIGENEDCILSQFLKHPEESDDEIMVDMSLPLASMHTPLKVMNDNVILNVSDKEQIDITQENVCMPGSKSTFSEDLHNSLPNDVLVDFDSDVCLNKYVDNNTRYWKNH